MAKRLVQSVKKALDVLDIMVFDDIDREGLPLAELSRRTDIPTNTLHGLISTLVECGYARQNDDSTYLAGKKVDDVGRQNLIRRKLPDTIPEILSEYQEKSGEGVVFYALINAEKVSVHTVNRKGVFNINFQDLRESSFFSTATSRVIFAFAGDEERQEILKKWGMPGEDWEDIGGEDDLKAASEKIAQQGYAESISHNGSVYNIACPVLEEQNDLFGAVGTYAPVSEMSAGQKGLFKDQMKKLAARIEQILESD